MLIGCLADVNVGNQYKFVKNIGYSVCDSMCPKIGNILLFGISNRKIRKTNLQLFYKVQKSWLYKMDEYIQYQ